MPAPFLEYKHKNLQPYHTDRSFEISKMSSLQTVVCVKKVKQEAMEDWDETMPLPGDVIEGVAEGDDEELFVSAKAKADLSSHLGKISQQFEVVWLKVKRGDATLKLPARIIQEKASILHRKFTIRAATDDRHVAVLGDLTLEQCNELQDLLHLPDHRSSVISSILFMPLRGEHSMEATTSRCMAWFCAAVSSGAPLVFVNIQSEQIVNVTQGFICVSAVTKGSAADRCGLGGLLDEATATNYLLLISRLEGKSVIPSNVSSTGLVHCCDQAEIRSALVSAMDRMDSVKLHIMALPDGSDAQANETSKLQTTRKLFPLSASWKISKPL